MVRGGLLCRCGSHNPVLFCRDFVQTPCHYKFCARIDDSNSNSNSFVVSFRNTEGRTPYHETGPDEQKIILRFKTKYIGEPSNSLYASSIASSKNTHTVLRSVTICFADISVSSWWRTKIFLTESMSFVASRGRDKASRRKYQRSQKPRHSRKAYASSSSVPQCVHRRSSLGIVTHALFQP